MWVRVVLMLVVATLCTTFDLRDSYLYEDDAEDADFEESFYETYTFTPLLTTTAKEARTRIRRYGINEKRSLDSNQIKDINDVLQGIFGNRSIATWAPVYTTKSSFNAYQDLEEAAVNNLSENTKTIASTPSIRSNKKAVTWLPVNINQVIPIRYSPMTSEQTLMGENTQTIGYSVGMPNIVSHPKIVTWVPETSSYVRGKNPYFNLQNSVHKEILRAPKISTYDATDDSYASSDYSEKTTIMELRTLDAQEIKKIKEALQSISRNATSSYDTTLSSTDFSESEVDTSAWSTTNHRLQTLDNLDVLRNKDEATTITLPTNTLTIPANNEINVTKSSMHAAKPTIRLDVQGLLDLIANLTYDYDMNLTQRFNETLKKHSVPTCGAPTTTTIEVPTTTPSEYDFANTSIVAKCFVCGLDKVEIPRDSYCADAFAGEFIPLVPVNPRARGQIATYRKYCRYLDVRGYMFNPEEPRSMYGRFTGGCSVRWIDLSGIYTQRTCRNRRRAVMGKHFTSKRMAKLEMALNDVDEGCIISPMATLVPLSRGISLYARFHACVCTGAWCNRTVQNDPWLLHSLIMFLYYKIL